MSDRITSYCYELVTQLKHPQTGEKLIDIEKIESVVNKHSSIIGYGYIIHDKDVFTEDDVIKGRCSVGEIGTAKPAHVHVLMKFSKNQDLMTVAKWFGFEDHPNFIEKKSNGRGRNDAFLDCLIYLTHEDDKQQKMGKRLYEDEEVTFWCSEGLKYREYIDKALAAIEERKSKYGTANISVRDQLRYDVLYGGMSLRTAYKEHPLEYNKDLTELKKRRFEYLRQCPAPPLRINFYVEGQGGAGKSLFCEALARAFIDPEHKMPDEDIFSNISGDGRVSFEDYDGQPVLIWDDFRHWEMLKVTGGRGEFFKIFSPTPSKTIVQKKNASANLINSVNIINSVQPFEDFKKGIVGKCKDDETGEWVEAEDKYKIQVDRRIPIFIRIREDDYDMGVYNGFFDDRYTEPYTMLYNIKHSLRKLIIACGENKELYKSISGKAVVPVVKQFERAAEQLKHPQMYPDDEIANMFSDVGEVKVAEGNKALITTVLPQMQQIKVTPNAAKKDNIEYYRELPDDPDDLPF